MHIHIPRAIFIATQVMVSVSAEDHLATPVVSECLVASLFHCKRTRLTLLVQMNNMVNDNSVL